MPYKSLKQERYFNANRAKLERQGVNVDEWNAASRGMKLPKVALSSKRLGKPSLGKPSLPKLGTRRGGGILKLGAKRGY